MRPPVPPPVERNRRTPHQPDVHNQEAQHDHRTRRCRLHRPLLPRPPAPGHRRRHDPGQHAPATVLRARLPSGPIRPLFRQALKAWINHPAVTESWAVSDKPTCKSCLDHDARDFLDEIYSVYGQFAPWKLRDMIAAEPPYRDTPAGADISHDSLRRFFRTRLKTRPV